MALQIFQISDDTNVAYVVELLQLLFRTTKTEQIREAYQYKHVHEPLQPPART